MTAQTDPPQLVGRDGEYAAMCALIDAIETRAADDAEGLARSRLC